MNMEPRKDFEYYVHALFEAGVALKAFNGLWETVTGFLALMLPHPAILRGYLALTHSELVEDPHDRLADVVGKYFVNAPHGTRTFIGIYVLLHGLANLFLAYNLYRKRLWAYPATIVVLGLFLIYQFYRIALFHSVVLIVLTSIDMIFMGLLVHEYRHQREKRTA
jgi:uncharacterized membrane protein